MERWIGALGIAAMLGVACAASVDRRAIHGRSIAVSVVLQFAIGAVALRTEAGAAAFEALRVVAVAFIGAADKGIDFVFGPAQFRGPFGEPLELPFSFAVRILPVIIFMASVFSVLHHVRVLPWAVRMMARALRHVLPVSGAEALSAAGNVFLGMTEAPLLIRPYVLKLTRSELHCVMAVGLATVSGAALLPYSEMLGGGYVGHLVTASFMSIPAAIAYAKIIVPELEEPQTHAGAPLPKIERRSVNLIDAAAAGARDGLRMVLNIAAMLVAFVALIGLLDAMLASAGTWIGVESLSFGRLLGWTLAPLAWLLGVPWADASAVGELLGIKTVVNEFVAYQQLGAHRSELEPRSVVIAAYALCGFANIGSIAILLGGLGSMAPERRSDMARDGMRALLAGSLASCNTAAVVGLIL